jgi:hypothetical protein
MPYSQIKYTLKGHVTLHKVAKNVLYAYSADLQRNTSINHEKLQKKTGIMPLKAGLKSAKLI